MENGFNNWCVEKLVATRMDDFRREMEAIQLLHDAGLNNPGLIERLAIALGKSLVRLGQRLHKDYTDPQRAYQVTTSKYAA